MNGQINFFNREHAEAARHLESLERNFKIDEATILFQSNVYKLDSSGQTFKQLIFTGQHLACFFLQDESHVEFVAMDWAHIAPFEDTTESGQARFGFNIKSLNSSTNFYLASDEILDAWLAVTRKFFVNTELPEDFRLVK